MADLRNNYAMGLCVKYTLCTFSFLVLVSVKFGKCSTHAVLIYHTFSIQFFSFGSVELHAI